MAARKSGSRSGTSKSRRSSGKSPKRGKSRGKWFSGNIHVALFLKLLLVLTLLFLSRIIFYLINLSYFSSLPFYDALRIFVTGLRFDISALFIINAPFILMNVLPFRFRYHRIYQGIANGFYYFINNVAFIANFVDSIYFRFTLKRMTIDIFRYLGVGGDFDKLIPQFLKDFWYVAIIWIVFSGVFIYLGTRIGVRQERTAAKGSGFSFYFVNTILAVLILGVSVIGIRGGLQLRPIGLVTAGQYTSGKNIPLVLNTPFSIARTVDGESLTVRKWFKSEAALSDIYNPVHPGMKGQKEQKLNVMIIIMESFSREHIGILNHEYDNGRYQGFTPFLDSLIRHGRYFDGFANGKTSIQGIPAILSGIPSLMNESIIQSNYAANKMNSIAALLKPKGYRSAFFHGGTNGTMGFDSYTKLVGFEHYYGRSEFNNEKEYDGKWGIRDESFFQFCAQTLNNLQQPFVATLFSLSSHHPYYVPGKYANVFRKGKLPIQQSIMYSDHALAGFFHQAKKSKWYANTLFIITADHTSEGYFPYYQSDVGQYAIPILFFQPGTTWQEQSPGPAQQTDILPTILNYLGYDKKFIAFGTDLFNPAAPRFSVHYIIGLYGMIKDGYYIEFDGNRCTSLFYLKDDPLLKNNLAGTAKPVEERLILFLKAYIQQYNNRVMENRLTCDA